MWDRQYVFIKQINIDASNAKVLIFVNIIDESKHVLNVKAVEYVNIKN